LLATPLRTANQKGYFLGTKMAFSRKLSTETLASRWKCVFIPRRRRAERCTKLKTITSASPEKTRHVNPVVELCRVPSAVRVATAFAMWIYYILADGGQRGPGCDHFRQSGLATEPCLFKRSAHREARQSQIPRRLRKRVLV